MDVGLDHQPLIPLMQKQHPLVRLLRWTLNLQEHNFKLHYHKGNNNTIVDCLSRHKQHAVQPYFQFEWIN
jgi:hypothetical protein